MSILSVASSSSVKRVMTSWREFSSVVSLQPPIVKIPDLGMLQGCMSKSAWSDKEIYQFMGVKYGQPPIGPRRFKAPIPVEPWEGIKKAERFGPISPVYRVIKKLPAEKLTDSLEDCLELSVYSGNLETKKPVMVYIHGGKLTEGGAFQHPPQFLLENDIVLVVPQYRLGPLGFLSTHTDEIPGNAGALDVILALQWVKKNIASFGGDPENITLAGQSAGACVISALTFSPIVPPNLFHKVIIQSASVFGHWMFDDDYEPKMRDIAQRCGMPENLPVDEINENFMKMDLLKLLRAFTQHAAVRTGEGANLICGNRLTVGGPSNFLPVHPVELIRNGDARSARRVNVPMLAGCVRDEGTYAMAQVWDGTERTGFNKKESTIVELVEETIKVCGHADVSGALGYLGITRFLNEKNMNATHLTDMLDELIDLSGAITFKSPVLQEVQMNRKNGPTYLYTFDYKGELSAFQFLGDTSRFPFKAGVAHGDDNMYLFPFPKTPMNADDTAMAKRMVDLWTSFAATGIPKSDGVPDWPLVENPFGPYLHLNKDCTIGTNFLDEFQRDEN